MDDIFIIGVAGGTGSGKTTVVEKVLEELSADKLCVISQDSYYKANDGLSYEERSKTNFDHPDAIDFDLLVKHLDLLKQGQTIEQPIYSFVEHNRTKETKTTKPQKVIIIEGILIFNDEKLRNLCDVKIFVHADMLKSSFTLMMMNALLDEFAVTLRKEVVILKKYFLVIKTH